MSKRVCIRHWAGARQQPKVRIWVLKYRAHGGLAADLGAVTATWFGTLDASVNDICVPCVLKTICIAQHDFDLVLLEEARSFHSEYKQLYYRTAFSEIRQRLSWEQDNVSHRRIDIQKSTKHSITLLNKTRIRYKEKLRDGVPEVLQHIDIFVPNTCQNRNQRFNVFSSYRTIMLP